MGSCTICEQELEQSLFLEIEVEGCSMCGGIWFPKGGVQAALKRAPTLLHKLEDQFQDLRLSKEPLPRKIRCPQCGAAMRRAAAKQIPGFEPHLCEKCGGVWVADGMLGIAELHFRAEKAGQKETEDETTDTGEGEAAAEPEQRPDKPPTLTCKACGNVNRADEKLCLKCDGPLAVEKREGHLEGQCPRCHTALYGAPRAGTRVQSCSECSGVWLPYAQLTELMADGAKRLGKLDTDFRVKPHTPGEDREIHRCPECGSDLQDTDYAVATPSGKRKRTGVLVHECPACRGVWFDSGESHDLSVKAKPLLTA